MRDIQSLFLETVGKYKMLQPGDEVVVGFSGGADSVCLLSLLNNNRDLFGIRLRAAHVNHELRGEESDADARFCVSFCEARGIPISLFRTDIASLAAERGQSTELCAREVRYHYFESLHADKIATAHTGSDAVETLLMNLSRGASLHGLCSIPAVRGNVIRPLIQAVREETERYCAENALPYVTDSTNLTDAYTRNKIRRNVIPELESVFPAFEHCSLRCIDNLRLEEDYVVREADKLFQASIHADRLLIEPLLQSHDALRYRVLYRFCRDIAGADVEEKHLNELIQKMRFSVFSIDLPGGVRVYSNGYELYLNSGGIRKAIPAPRSFDKRNLSAVVFHKYRLFIESCERVTGDVFQPDVLDFEKIDDIIEIRSVRSSDMIRLPKRNCSKSLKKYYTELHIPADEWRAYPVLADAKGLIWAYRAGADLSRIATEKTNTRMIIHTESDKNEQ